MTQSALNIAEMLRPHLTTLYVNYFRMSPGAELTGPQLTILTWLKKHGASRISEIARNEGIQMPTASNAIHHLADRDLVERTRDPHDHRGVQVSLTEKGAALLHRVGRERSMALAEMLSVLEPEELEQVEKVAPIFDKLAHRYTLQTEEK
ncbi:MAG: MarR family transcriptional regulator [Corynebacterium sp.]|nr:MarR family transcriptional regulator [Corynebacterium sp.]